MNQGLFGTPGNPPYKDFIFGLTAGTIWDIPFTAPPDSMVYFDYELLDAGSALAAGIGFLFNNRPAVDHVSQTLTTTGATVTGASVASQAGFTAVEVNGMAAGSGFLSVGRNRITYESRSYRGAPGVNITLSQHCGILNAPAPTLAATPFYSGISKLRLVHAGSVGFAKGSRFRLYEPQPVHRNC